MKLLVVTPFYKPAYVYGGPPRSISALCEGFVGDGNEVTVFTTNANGTDTLEVAGNPLEVDGVQVCYFPRDLPGSYFFSPELARACYSHASQFDLIYISSNWVFPFFPACRAACKSGVPYVVTPRTSYMRKTWKGKYVKKVLYHYAIERTLTNRASAIHYTTQLEVQESQWLGLRPNYFIVPNPVSFEEFDHLPISGKFRQKWQIAADAEMLLFLGRVEQRKGLDITLPAFARIVDEFPQVKLVIAGPDEDNYQMVLRDMAKKLQIRDRVTFTGYLNPSERLEALVDADIFVLTSYSENFGMAVVEAMASGVPVILSDQVGIADVIEESKSGLVTTLDIENIAVALRTFLQSRVMRVEYGENAENASRFYFAPHKVARAMASEFKDICVNSL